MTGASGFIGGHLVARLLELGVEVHAVSRAPRSEPQVVWHRVELAEIDLVRRLIAHVSPDVVYHLASRVTGSRDRSEVVPTLEGNLLTAVGVLLGATESGCRRVVLVGSMEEPAAGSGVPSSPYAAAKLAATTYASLFHNLYALSVVNLRLFMVYGPGQEDTTKLVPYAITSLLAGAAPELSSGQRPVDWVYIGDVVDALLASASATAGDDAVPIDIGSGALVTIREIVEHIARRIGGQVAPRFGILPDRVGDRVTAANVERARACLSWQPTTSLVDGLDTTIAWYTARSMEAESTR